ncbi:MAG: hypothetical protein QXG05_04470 [Nitrososphaerota archaeon]
MADSEQGYECAICHAQVMNKPELIKHLNQHHEILEVISYAATTMIFEQERDRQASEYHRQFQHIKRELQGSD